ncbi:MAG: hypothetical protein RQ729_07295 [Wenzhouxiangellaceae bacterium]|nr:hypothetical protein [Wenzhouxiangellaceae bacterium]
MLVSMTVPQQLRRFVSTSIVSLSAIGFALVLACFPVYRILAGQWPAPIVEEIAKDGRLLLSDRAVPHNDAVVRSRPRHAVRVQLADGGRRLGYMVALREPSREHRPPPQGMEWLPPDDGCELGLLDADGQLDWLACASVREVVRPNAMNFSARLRVAWLRIWQRAG